MKALVLKSPECVAVMDVPRPTATRGQAIVQVHMCGVCGSDVRYFHGENPWAKQTLQREIPNPPNIILGHEFVGTVVEVADRDDEHWLGKRVGVQTWTTCGVCDFCRTGRENFCRRTIHLGHGQGWGEMDFYPGGMAEFCPAFTAGLHQLPVHVSDAQATFFDPLTAALHAVDVAPPAMLSTVLILGAGPIGLSILQIARAQGAGRTLITDIVADNLTLAQKLGADDVLLVDAETDLVAWVEATSGRNTIDRVFNTVGSNQSINDSLQVLDVGGVVVLMATKDKELCVPALALSGERKLTTSTNAKFSDFRRVIDLVASGKVNVDAMISHRFPLYRGEEAIAAACNKAESGAVKVVIDCSQSGPES